MSVMSLGNIRYRHGGEVAIPPSSDFTSHVPVIINRSHSNPMWQISVPEVNIYKNALHDRVQIEPITLRLSPSLGIKNNAVGARRGAKQDSSSAPTRRFIHFREWNKALAKVSHRNPNADGESFERPNRLATGNARSILMACHTVGSFPLRLGASVEGGIGFTFMLKDRVGYIEADNLGSIVAGYFSDTEGPRTWEVTPDIRDLTKAVRTVTRFVYTA